VGQLYAQGQGEEVEGRGMSLSLRKQKKWKTAIASGGKSNFKEARAPTM